MFDAQPCDTQDVVGNSHTFPLKCLMLEDSLVLSPLVFVWKIDYALSHCEFD